MDETTVGSKVGQIIGEVMDGVDQVLPDVAKTSVTTIDTLFWTADGKLTTLALLLIDGDVAGIWKNKNGKLEIKCFCSLSQAEKSYVEQAADKLWGNIKAIKYCEQ